MRFSLVKNLVGFNVDKLICAVWEGNANEAGRTLSLLKNALAKGGTEQKLDETFMQALDRVAAFYCLERRFEECDRLLVAVRRTILDANTAGNREAALITIDKRIKVLAILRTLHDHETTESASSCGKIGAGW